MEVHTRGGGQERKMVVSFRCFEGLDVLGDTRSPAQGCSLNVWLKEKWWWVRAKPLQHWETRHSSLGPIPGFSLHTAAWSPLPQPSPRGLSTFTAPEVVPLPWRYETDFCPPGKSTQTSNCLISPGLWRALLLAHKEHGRPKVGRDTRPQFHSHNICVEPRLNFPLSLSACLQPSLHSPSSLLSSDSFVALREFFPPPLTYDLRLSACILLPVPCGSITFPGICLSWQLWKLRLDLGTPTSLQRGCVGKRWFLFRVS